MGQALLEKRRQSREQREDKNSSSWNLHAGKLSIEVTVLQLENYQLRLCPKCLKNTKAVTETCQLVRNSKKGKPYLHQRP